MRYLQFVCWSGIIIALVAYAPVSNAGDWPRFRGPNGSGIAADNKPAPTEWSPTKNLKWKTPLPGPGVSSPIVVGDRAFVTCYSGYGVDRRNLGNMKDLKRHLVCIDRKSGKILWNKSVPATLPEDPFSGLGVPAHGYASHTPVSDGERVYVFFGKTGALAFDMDGKKLWQKNLGKDSDPKRWGSASSPIVYKDKLIVTAAAESRSVVGLDAKTGKEVWRAKAPGLADVWGTPVLAKVDDKRTDLVVAVSYETWGLDPATGKLRWYNESMSASNSSPVVRDGILFTIEGRGGGGAAVRVGGKDNTTKSHTLWKGRVSNRYASPIVFKGRVYVVANNTVTCVDAKSGKEIYKERLLAANSRSTGGGQRGAGGRGGRGGRGRGGFGGGGFGGGDYSSPVVAGGNLYYISNSGDAYVIQTGDKFKQLAVNRVTNEGESFAATPAISNGEIFIRSNRHLYCVSNSAGADAKEAPSKDAKSNDVDAEDANQLVAFEGASAALTFEKNFRSERRRQSKPVDPACCCSITPLSKEMWTKEQVLADFAKNRDPDQVGVVVFVKTEFCCKGSRLCAVTTAALEKKSTPLVGRFRIYMAWIKANPDHQGREWKTWEQQVIREYKFVQGPGARIVAMVPKEDGKNAEWSSNARNLGLAATSFDRSKGQTPRLERFLRTAVENALSSSSDRAAQD